MARVLHVRSIAAVAAWVSLDLVAGAAIAASSSHSIGARSA